MFGTWLLLTEDCSPISEYTYILNVCLISAGNFYCILLFWLNIENYKVCFPKVICNIDCNPKISSCMIKRSAKHAIANVTLELSSHNINIDKFLN